VRTAGFTAAWLAAATLAVLAAALGAMVGETRPAGTAPAGERRLVHRPSVPVGIVFLASTVAMGGFLAFAALQAESVQLSNASLPLVAYGSVVVIVRIAFATVTDRIPPLRLAAAALTTMAAGLLVVVCWPTPAGAVAGAAITGAGIAFSTPALFAAIFALAGAGERGAASATASVALDLGIGLGPMGLGLVANAAGIAWAFVVAAIVALLGAGWALRLAPGESR